MEECSWKFIFYDVHRKAPITNALLGEIRAKDVVKLYGHVAPKNTLAKSTFSFSINDILRFNGKSYKIKKFDLNVYNYELHIYVFDNDISFDPLN